MFQANVYKVMIGAPSDIKEEINIAKKVLQEWNIDNTETQKIVLLPLHWSRDAYPLSGVHPQKTIDKQLVEKSDLLICIFGTRIGTQTDSSESGTVEEIYEHLNADKQVMIFFKKSCSDVNDIDIEQITRLKTFKRSIQDMALLGEFNDATDFGKILAQKLQRFVKDHFINYESRNQHIESSKPLQLSEFDIKRLKTWISAKSPQFFQERCLEGYKQYMLGYGNYHKVNVGKEDAEWNDFFNKLLKAELISIETYKKELPIYKLTKKAYDFIEKLESETT